MGTYVIGGLVLFSIGFITYEIIEGIKEAKTELDNAMLTPVTVLNTVSTVGDFTNPISGISYAAGGLGSLLGEYAADLVLEH